MSEAKHTPSPITVKKDTQPWVGYYLYDQDDNCIGGTSFENEIDEANANLWASAPDLLAERDRLRAENAEMLEACQAMINEYTQYETLADTEILGRAAIANATRKEGK
jgi:hypothetical protein